MSVEALVSREECWSPIPGIFLFFWRTKSALMDDPHIEGEDGVQTGLGAAFCFQGLCFHLVSLGRIVPGTLKGCYN